MGFHSPKLLEIKFSNFLKVKERDFAAPGDKEEALDQLMASQKSSLKKTNFWTKPQSLYTLKAA